MRERMYIRVTRMPHPQGFFLHPAYTMASGMVRSAALTLQEERTGLGTSKSNSLVAFCDKFLSAIKRSEKDMELFDTFSQVLVKELQDIFSMVSSRIKSADRKKEKIWSTFHEVRVKTLPKMWENFFKSIGMESSPIFSQSVSFKVFEMLVKEHLAPSTQACAQTDIVFTTDELNAMRYACGYVPFSLLRKYESGRISRSDQCIECLGNMAVVGENDDLEAYTRHWINLVNRGGLFPLNDQSFMFFVAVEKKVRRHLASFVSTQGALEELVEEIVEDDDIQWEWCLVSQDIDSIEESMEVLKDIVKLWVTVRGFSLAASWLEAYKKEEKLTTQKSTGLRKGLSGSSQ